MKLNYLGSPCASLESPFEKAFLQSPPISLFFFLLWIHLSSVLETCAIQFPIYRNESSQFQVSKSQTFFSLSPFSCLSPLPTFLMMENKSFSIFDFGTSFMTIKKGKYNYDVTGKRIENNCGLSGCFRHKRSQVWGLNPDWHIHYKQVHKAENLIKEAGNGLFWIE